MAFTPKVVVPVPLPASTRWFICRENEVLLKKDSVGLEQLPSGASFHDLEPQMVGELDGVPCVCVRFPDQAPTPEGFEFIGLRALWARLDERLFGIAGRANQLAHFASTHRFCGRCGTAMKADGVERAFRCGGCGLVNYPRIAPAIITLVRKGDTALLANSGRFPIPFFSTLAGFSEVGESLEETLVREVFEETGVHAGDVRYFGSQPWPFPNSLMIAFTAKWERGDIVVDGKEIKEARFFRADELPRIPPKLSIARRLIDAWVREVTGQDAPGP